MLKRGFTLAEVLITLLIVGVVATLTTPALVKNVGSSKIGPQLAKFVNTFETAAETMMMKENVGTLSAAVTSSILKNDDPKSEPEDCVGEGPNRACKEIYGPSVLECTNNLLTVLSPYMVMTNLQNITNPASLEIKSSADGSVLRTVKFSQGQVWQLKDGTLAYILDVSAVHQAIDLTTGEPIPSIEDLGTLYIDIGGIKGSHRAGKEVFAFKINNAGYLIPYGSNAHKAIAPSMANISCNHNGDLKAQLACTGAVADNAYKAPW